MKLKAAVRSEAGGRARNEDVFVVSDELLVLADGAGTISTDGAVVAGLGVTEIVASIGARTNVGAALEAANTVVTARIAGDPSWRGVLASVVAAHVAGDYIRIAHAGDCRAYAAVQGRLVCLTKDHGLARDGARWDIDVTSYPTNVVTSALGFGEQFAFDVMAFRPPPDSTLVLCTRGIWQRLPDADIARVLEANTDPAAAVNALAGLARTAAPGPDLGNYTAIVARIA